ncbi:hypothetical protein H310_07806 [Aphanomyces invadans]|uniref:Protein kinase domain-containing protein n=1 Tax=Aphanomyces invadans TaxID=157072 RepID=A0A024U2A7_9STRA|nr:hypothetical protein H310_07806 [Aphanomyces invadans]ETV99752.1 hypothetical protein H310_07806 [Aphanomyces invadans]|eukprot:XP_008871528.1 hypothetical protein H310_07806 [Aphanomyces invadans]
MDIMPLAESMDCGDLRGILDTNRADSSLHWSHKLQCAVHIAHGVSHLHARTIVNANLTSFNVSRGSTLNTRTASVGSFRWVAPEVMRGDQVAPAADVYWVSVILAELDTNASRLRVYLQGDGCGRPPKSRDRKTTTG